MARTHGAAYYNEHDPFAAAWLRELITAGVICPGEVDERSIEVVDAVDLRGFTQAHFFAGIGGWSYALRLAGWPDDRDVWTGSCPCQPFSAAGRGKGFTDARHLWPAWFRLIAECRPSVLFGEQVDKALAWLDLVYADLEGAGYAVGAVDLPAACVGAFHIRQRLWFVADAQRERTGWGSTDQAGSANTRPIKAGELASAAWENSASRDVAESENQRHERGGTPRRGRDGFADARADGDVADTQSGGQRADGRASGHAGHADERDEASNMADSDERHALDRDLQRSGQHGLRTEDRRVDGDSRQRERSEISLADTEHAERWTVGRENERNRGHAGRPQAHRQFGACSAICTLDDTEQQRAGRSAGSEGRAECSPPSGREDERRGQLQAINTSAVDELGNADSTRHALGARQYGNDGAPSGHAAGQASKQADASFWTECEWINCRDGKARPVEPGTFPLAHGVPARVGRLRGYGNAIVPQVAQTFIEAYLDAQSPRPDLSDLRHPDRVSEQAGRP